MNDHYNVMKIIRADFLPVVIPSGYLVDEFKAKGIEVKKKIDRWLDDLVGVEGKDWFVELKANIFGQINLHYYIIEETKRNLFYLIWKINTNDNYRIRKSITKSLWRNNL